MKPIQNTILISILLAIAAFVAGRWSTSSVIVKADSGESATIQVQPVRGDTSITVYYPELKKMFVYQSPFVGLPTWDCSYSIQLSTPGGSIERKPCANQGQHF